MTIRKGLQLRTAGAGEVVEEPAPPAGEAPPPTVRSRRRLQHPNNVRPGSLHVDIPPTQPVEDSDGSATASSSRRGHSGSASSHGIRGFPASISNSASTLDRGAFHLVSLSYSSVFMFRGDSTFRLRLYRLVVSKFFEAFIVAIILLNCLTLSLDSPDVKEGSTRANIINYSEYIFTSFFIVEMILKIIAFGFCFHPGSYLRSGWNRLDFLIVLASIPVYFDQSNFSLIRLLRVLKPLRTVSSVSGLRVIISSILDSLPSLAHIFTLMLLIFFVFGTLGVELWNGVLRNRCYIGDAGAPLNLSYFRIEQFCSNRSGSRGCSSWPENPSNAQCMALSGVTDLRTSFTSPDGNPSMGFVSFDNVLWAFLLVFQVMTLEGWSDVMYELQDAYSPWAAVYFVLLVVLGAYFVLNLALAVINASYEVSENRHASELRNFKIKMNQLNTLAHALRTGSSEGTSGRTSEEVQDTPPPTPDLINDDWEQQQRQQQQSPPQHGGEDAELSPGSAAQTPARISQKQRQKIVRTSSVDAVPGKATAREGEEDRDSGVRASTSTVEDDEAKIAEVQGRGRKRKDKILKRKSVSFDERLVTRLQQQGKLSEKNLRLHSNEEGEEPTPQPLHERSSSYSNSDVEVIDATATHTNTGNNFEDGEGSDGEKSDGNIPSTSSESVVRNVRLGEWSRSHGLSIETGPGKGKKAERKGDGEKEEEKLMRPTAPPKQRAGERDGRRVRGVRGRSIGRSVTISHPGDVPVSAIPPRARPLPPARPRWYQRIFSSCRRLRRVAAEPVTPLPSKWARDARHIFRGILRSEARRVPHARDSEIVRVQRYDPSRELSPLRKRMRVVINSGWFRWTVIALIVINTLMLMTVHHDMPEAWEDALDIGNLIITVLFVVEMLVKWVALGFREYFAVGFNVFDFIIVVTSVIDVFAIQSDSTGIAGFRALRLLRVARLFRAMQSLQTMLVIIMRAIKDVGLLLILFVLSLFLNALLGMTLYGGKFEEISISINDTDIADPVVTVDRGLPRATYDDFYWSFLTAFQLLTGENWNEVMWSAMQVSSTFSFLFFVVTWIIGQIIVVNLFIAILIRSFQKQHEERFDTPKTGDSANSRAELNGPKRRQSGGVVERTQEEQRVQDEREREREREVLGDSELPVTSDDVDGNELPFFDRFKRTVHNIARRASDTMGVSRFFPGTSAASADPSARAGAEGESSSHPKRWWQGSSGPLGNTGESGHSYTDRNPPLEAPAAEGTHRTRRSTDDTGRTHTSSDETRRNRSSSSEFTGHRDSHRITGPLTRSRFPLLQSAQPTSSFRGTVPHPPGEGEEAGERERDAEASRIQPLVSSSQNSHESLSLSDPSILHLGEGVDAVHAVSEGSCSDTETGKSHELLSMAAIHGRFEGDEERGRERERERERERSRDPDRTEGECTSPRTPGGETPTPKSSKSSLLRRISQSFKLLRRSDTSTSIPTLTRRLSNLHKAQKKAERNVDQIWKLTRVKSMISRTVENIRAKIREREFSKSDSQHSRSETDISNRLQAPDELKRSPSKIKQLWEHISGFEPRWKNGPVDDSRLRSDSGSFSGFTPETEGAGVASFVKAMRKTASDAMKDVDKSQRKRAFFLLPPSRIRRHLHRFVTSVRFEITMVIIIVFSSLTLAFDKPICTSTSSAAGVECMENGTFRERFLHYSNIAVLGIFGLEMALKMLAMGFAFHPGSYLRDRWNVFDMIIVALSAISELFDGADVSGLRVVRTLRVLRTLRLIKYATGIKAVVFCLYKSFAVLLHVGIVLIFFFIIFGIMGVQFFGGKLYSCTDPTVLLRVDCNGTFFSNETLAVETREWRSLDRNYNNIVNSMLTLFEVLTLEAWPDIMYEAIDAHSVDEAPLRDANPAAGLFFVAFITICSFFLLNLFVGVIIDKFADIKDELDGLLFVTKEQREWIDMQRLIGHFRPPRYAPKPKFWLRRWCYVLIHKVWFEPFVAILIGINVIISSMVHFNASMEMVDFIRYSNAVLSIIFTIEVIIKLYALSLPVYKSEPWNVFDFVIVVLSNVGTVYDIFVLNVENDLNDDTDVLVLMRIFRILRVFRLVRRVKGLNMLVETMWFSIPSLFNVTAFLSLVYFVYAIVGISFFGDIQLNGELTRQTNFQSFEIALLTLVRITTGESWGDIMYACTIQEPDCLSGHCGSRWAALYFVSFYLVQSFILINLFLAVILDNFNNAVEADKSALKNDHIHKFCEVWSHYDPKSKEHISTSQLQELLMEMGPPLGLKQDCSRLEVIQKMVKLDIPEHAGRIHFVETLVPLARMVVGRREEEKMGRLKEMEDTRKWRRLFPSLKALPEATYTTGGHCSATWIQAAYRGNRLRQAMRRWFVVHENEEEDVILEQNETPATLNRRGSLSSDSSGSSMPYVHRQNRCENFELIFDIQWKGVICGVEMTYLLGHRRVDALRAQYEEDLVMDPGMGESTDITIMRQTQELRRQLRSLRVVRETSLVQRPYLPPPLQIGHGFEKQTLKLYTVLKRQRIARERGLRSRLQKAITLSRTVTLDEEQESEAENLQRTGSESSKGDGDGRGMFKSIAGIVAKRKVLLRTLKRQKNTTDSDLSSKPKTSTSIESSTSSLDLATKTERIKPRDSYAASVTRALKAGTGVDRIKPRMLVEYESVSDEYQEWNDALDVVLNDILHRRVYHSHNQTHRFSLLAQMVYRSRRTTDGTQRVAQPPENPPIFKREEQTRFAQFVHSAFPDTWDSEVLNSSGQGPSTNHNSHASIASIISVWRARRASGDVNSTSPRSVQK